MERTALYKQNAMDFYALAFNEGKPREAIHKYAGDHYKQHNPHVADGKEAFIEYFEKMAKEYPNKKVHFKKALVDEDMVILHCLQEWEGFPDYASVDIFRVDENGKVVEHWDVIQEIPEEAAHNNTMF